MPTDSGPADPRKFWRLAYRIARVTPSWVMSLCGLLARLLFRVTRITLRGRVPRHLGFYVWTGGINAALYEARLVAALDLLDRYAPVYLRWLQRTFHILFVDQVLRIMRDPVRPDYWVRMLGLNPYAVWHASGEQLARYLVVEATRGRLGRRFRRTRAGRIRASRRGLEEMVACARLLPGAPALVECEERLRKFDERCAIAAA